MYYGFTAWEKRRYVEGLDLFESFRTKFQYQCKGRVGLLPNIVPTIFNESTCPNVIKVKHDVENCSNLFICKATGEQKPTESPLKPTRALEPVQCCEGSQQEQTSHPPCQMLGLREYMILRKVVCWTELKRI